MLSMNSNESQVIIKESSRLDSMGIPYDHIHCSEGKPVVTVTKDVLQSIISMRDQGEHIPGLFISYDGKEWIASKIDESGNLLHRSGLTECKAYRWVLGYPIGHRDRNSHYAGGPIYRTKRKKRRVVNQA